MLLQERRPLLEKAGFISDKPCLKAGFLADQAHRRPIILLYYSL